MGWYIPKAVWPKLDAGLDTNIAEIREVSVLFINCHNLDLAAGPDGDVTGGDAPRHRGDAHGAEERGAVGGGGEQDARRRQGHA